MVALPPGAQTAVVGDQEQGAGVVGQGLLQVFDERRGEVVRRLVQQQDVAGTAQQAGQGQALALAGGQFGDPGRQAFGGEQAEREEAFGVLLGVAGQARA